MNKASTNIDIDAMPEFDDRLMVCQDCGAEYVFEKGEQEYFWSKGLAEPKRCPECRRHRRATINRPREEY